MSNSQRTQDEFNSRVIALFESQQRMNETLERHIAETLGMLHDLTLVLSGKSPRVLKMSNTVRDALCAEEKGA